MSNITFWKTVIPIFTMKGRMANDCKYEDIVREEKVLAKL